MYVDTTMFDEIIKNISFEKNKYDDTAKLIRENLYLFERYTLSQGKENAIFFFDNRYNEGLEIEFNEDKKIIRLGYYDKYNRLIEIINNEDGKKFFTYIDRNDENEKPKSVNSMDELIDYLKSTPVNKYSFIK